MNLGKILRKP
jgi:hypothetical protein